MNALRLLLTCLLIPFLIVGAALDLSADNPPREAALLIEIQTPILSGGKQVGMMKLPAGTKVTVVSEQADGYLVSRGGFEPFKVAKAAIATTDAAPADTSSSLPASAPAVVPAPAKPDSAVAPPSSAGSQPMPKFPVSTSRVPILAATGIETGLAVKIGPSTLEELTALTNGGRMLVEALVPDRASADALRDQVGKAGLLGVITVKHQSPGPLPYVSATVNLLIADLDAKGAPDAGEIARIIAPLGATYLRKGGAWAATRIPLPAAMNEWPQANNGPNQNAYSADPNIGPSTGMRWFAPHSFYFSNKMPMRLVGGRLFTFGQQVIGSKNAGGTMQIEARDAMNGVLLWQVPLEIRFGDTHREWFVANEHRVYAYLSMTDPLTCLDARTGAIVRQFTDGPTVAVGEQGKDAKERIWVESLTAQVVLADDLLISILKNSIRVYDEATGTLKWSTEIPDAFRMRAGVGGGKLFLLVGNWEMKDGRGLHVQTPYSDVFAFDLKTGKQVWKAESLIAKGDLAATYLPPIVVGDRVLLSLKYHTYQGKLVPSGGDWALAALDAATGKTLWREATPSVGGSFPTDIWTFSGSWINPATEAMWIGYVNKCTGIDIKTGKMIKDIPIRGRNCFWTRGIGKWYTASEHFVDVETNAVSIGGGVRSPCNDGLFPAYGSAYIWSQSCPCNLFFSGKAAMVSEGLPVPASDAARLETFAPVELGPEFPKGASWPMYMGNAGRSGITASPLSPTIAPVWTTPSLAKPLAVASGAAGDWTGDATLRPLTAPVVEGGSLVVARSQTGEVLGLDASTGTARWTTRLGGRVDSSPTLWRGMAYVGCRDGWVYCLGLDDGKIRWRYQVAINNQQMVLAGQLESKWPVLGTVLIHEGFLYACAGRQAQFDGGMIVAKLDPATGKAFWRAPITSVRNIMNAIINEPMLVKDGRIWMGKVSLGIEDGAVVDEVGKRMGNPLHTFNDPNLSQGNPVKDSKKSPPRVPTDNVPSNTGLNDYWYLRQPFPGLTGLAQPILLPGSFLLTGAGSCLNLIYDEQGTITAGLHGRSTKGGSTKPDGLRAWGPKQVPLDTDKRNPNIEPQWINNGNASAMVANATTVATVSLAGRGTGNAMYLNPLPQTWTVYKRSDGAAVGAPVTLPGIVSWRGVAVADGKVYFTFEDGSVACWK
jgi:outer membrane protein assembly factor BamB